MNTYFDKVKEKDWYKCRQKSGVINVRRSQILRIVFIAKDIFRKGLPITKSIFFENLEKARLIGFKHLNEIEELNWGKLRDILRNMKKKYDQNSNGFDEFLAEARCMWRTENEK